MSVQVLFIYIVYCLKMGRLAERKRVSEDLRLTPEWQCLLYTMMVHQGRNMWIWKTEYCCTINCSFVWCVVCVCGVCGVWCVGVCGRGGGWGGLCVWGVCVLCVSVCVCGVCVYVCVCVVCVVCVCGVCVYVCVCVCGVCVV
jgi:hypothetical protein